MERQSTFFLPSALRKDLLQGLQKREQFFDDAEPANKHLCFSASAFQRTHPGMMRPDWDGNVHIDADVTLVSPFVLGVADGVSSLKEDLGVDGSELPTELLSACKEIAMSQLLSESPKDTYGGPISLLKEAYEETESLGSTTVLLSVLDNSSIVHGQLHPMIAVLTIGDCELLLLRRTEGPQSPLAIRFHTEAQRVSDRADVPLQLARVDERVDPGFTEDCALEVIEAGSAVQCVTTYEGDIVLLGSDGVFDNLFHDEIVDICNFMIPPPEPGCYAPVDSRTLNQIAEQIVHQSHAKTQPGAKNVYPLTPIGKGGKMDDTSVVVAEVVEWDDDLGNWWSHQNSRWDDFQDLFTCINERFSAHREDSERCTTCHFGLDGGRWDSEDEESALGGEDAKILVDL
jgi:serine/threonine protein phosphatase PrpC